MVEVLRVPAATPTAAANTTPTAAPTPTATIAPPGLRLEISNGNGVTGAAARLARSLNGMGWKVVRLSNLKPYAVQLSRIEYPRAQLALARTLALRLGLSLRARDGEPESTELRIVLGHDAPPMALALADIKKPSGWVAPSGR